jgi:hypothetical protein
MSRGPGIWQRRILAVLERQPAVFLLELLPRPYTRAQHVALNRAAWKLFEQGRIDMMQAGRRCSERGRWFVRPGYECNRDQVPRLNVAPH